MEKVQKTTNNFTTIFSTNDPFVELEKNQKIFTEKLGAKIIIQKDKGHFTEDDNVMEMPIVLEKLFKI